MVLEEATIDNFRTLVGQTIKLNRKMTFVVGENNLGKTNFLDFIGLLFGRTSIPEGDFRDPSKPITSTFKMRLTQDEIGLLGDVCDIGDPFTVTVKMTADTPDSDMEFMHAESGEPIPGKLIRRFNVFRYSSTSSDASNLNFGKERGVGKVLARGLSIYQQRHGKTTADFLNVEEFSDLMKYLNDTFGSLPILGDYGMHVSIDETDADALGSAITLADGNDLHFRRVGSGVQYVAMLLLSIVEGMIKMGERRLAEAIVENDDGKRSFSCIISLDEPEAHLHPYMQRRLVKALSSVSEGEDEAFNALLKDFFGVDKFAAQIVIATHSPNILRKSHEEIVRLFESEAGGVEVANGVDVALDFSAGKHFVDRFEFVREAFFVKSVLIVEGPSEASALPRMAETMGIDVDDFGLLVLQVGGQGSISPACKLLKAFKIECMSVEDRDDGSAVLAGDSITTERRDFEEEIVDALLDNDRLDIFLDVLEQYGQDPKKLVVQKGSLNKYAKKIGFDEFGVDVKLSDLLVEGKMQKSAESKALMYTWLSKEKSGVLGAVVGGLLPIECIPLCYQSAIKASACIKEPVSGGRS
ncbi:MAG: AAA family ATPase [Eggerthellaceae bacterium]|nr:AAA family ATPase [Eggerthellaceae bacterium]